ncbi:MAG: hypothetical protein IJ019_05710 [Alphaproteobacteria bacterium]|nr:hypothetical protein [Alphaproteobacteria bacterium]
MDKKEKHAKAEEFRARISMTAQRQQAINELAGKKEYSESDKVRLNVLFQKTSYAVGCEKEYRLLIARLKNDDSPLDTNKVTSFEAKI